MALGWSRRSPGSWVEPCSTVLTDGAFLPKRVPLRPARMQHLVSDPPGSARIEGCRGDYRLASTNPANSYRRAFAARPNGGLTRRTLIEGPATLRLAKDRELRTKANVLSRKFVDSRRRVGRGPSPPDRSFCGLPKPTTIHLVAPLSAGELPRHSVSGGEGSCPARRFVGVSLTRETSRPYLPCPRSAPIPHR
jgi:hypothetical protein